MFNLSETANCHYEPFTIAGAIFRETDRTNLYSLYIYISLNEIFFKIMQTLYWRDFKDFKYLNRNDNKELLKIGYHYER